MDGLQTDLKRHYEQGLADAKKRILDLLLKEFLTVQSPSKVIGVNHAIEVIKEKA